MDLECSYFLRIKHSRKHTSTELAYRWSDRGLSYAPRLEAWSIGRIVAPTMGGHGYLRSDQAVPWYVEFSTAARLLHLIYVLTFN